MTLPEIDDATRARIIAEERVRAEARAEVEQEATHASRPNYWGGFVLNLLVIGLGFLFIGEAIAGVIWFVAALALLMGLGLNLWPFLVVASLMHYNVFYMRKYNTEAIWGGYLWAGLIFLAVMALINFFYSR